MFISLIGLRVKDYACYIPMNKPEKYTLKAGYKFKVNGSIVVVHFYKYTGLYLFQVKYDCMISWNYFINQEICHKSMNILKNMYDVKPIKYNKNKKHNIELSPAGSCLFDCPMCDCILYLRNQVWELDDRWYDCENQGIYMQTDRKYLASWHDPKDDELIKYEIDIDDIIKSVDEFKQYIKNKFIVSYNCDVCRDNHAYDDIYFCKQCEVLKHEYNDEYANDDDIAPDVYNLCTNCYTDANIKSHADKCNNYCGFYMKPTVL